MRWIDSFDGLIERHPIWACALMLTAALFYPDWAPDRYERRVIALELPPCDDCTKPQLRVWTVGNANPLIMPRPLGAGPEPRID